MPITTKQSANYINHIAFVLDASGSMGHLTKDVVRVADEQIAHLAKRSKEFDQETRVSVYVFDTTVTCVIFDKDVLRMPSIADHYLPMGMTALIDATMKSQEDLAKTAQMYGDHAFLTYVVTDGEENSSKYFAARDLTRLLSGQAENWTLAVLVPDRGAAATAEHWGFPRGNIAQWNSTTKEGLQEASNVITRSVDSYYQSRSQGVRGSRSLFSMDAAALNKDTIKAAKLKAVPKSKYRMLNIDNTHTHSIRDFVESQLGVTYVLGMAYYQLTKPEDVQAQKNVCVRLKKNGNIYVGSEARNLLGLPAGDTIRVRPSDNPDYEVFIQSTSVNRRLVPGTRLLVMV